MTDAIADQTRLALALKAARDNLTRAQGFLTDPGDRTIVQGAIDRVDIVALGLPEWVQK